MNYAVEKGQEPRSQAGLEARQLFHQHLGEVGFLLTLTMSGKETHPVGTPGGASSG